MSFDNDSIFFSDSQDPQSYSLENQMAEHLEFSLAKSKSTFTSHDLYYALGLSLRDRLIRRWIRTQYQYQVDDVKTINYLSLEFLMGRILGNTLTNLGFYKTCYDILNSLGYNLEDIIDEENDMGLGNGGLGRLAACFLDSMATLELPAYGYGIRYEHGIFKQEIENGFQIEKPDSWLSNGNPWELIQPDLTVRIKFYGKVENYHDNGKLIFNWVDTDDVLAVPYDTPIPGYLNNTVNTLRLWKATSTNDFNFHYFNQGNFFKSVEQKTYHETISKVLYPNDNFEAGKELRLKQQYFFVAATLKDILRRFKAKYQDLSIFPEKNTIQLNDTHPTLAIPELMRILIDEEGLEWETAWNITTKTFAYTNHTVMGEALEKWDVNLIANLLPRHLQIINEINHQFLKSVSSVVGYDENKMRNLSIFEEGNDKKIKMANLAIIGSFSVNGVAGLHTDILKKDIFKNFYELTPNKFNNKTNGITQRRWLKKANPYLSELICDTIGDGWVKDLYKIKELEDYINNNEFIENWQNAKWLSKKLLIDYLFKEYRVELHPDSMFDSQVKRMHEYKRQLLNCLHVLHYYFSIKDKKNIEFTPRTVIFAGKAAPAYNTVKVIIKFINCIAELINNDKEINDLLKVFFVPNYSVTLAEKIIPASDLSEQLSTAGCEASGTGNMKFQLNGALTIGTMDGANIEMYEELGKENIFIFGNSAEEINKLRESGYNPHYYYETNFEIRRIVDFIGSGILYPANPDFFQPIHDELLYNDRYFLLADFDSYIKKQNEISILFRDKTEWAKKSIINTARSGKFSSDRTIAEYVKDIWKLKKVTINSKDLIN